MRVGIFMAVLMAATILCGAAYGAKSKIQKPITKEVRIEQAKADVIRRLAEDKKLAESGFTETELLEISSVLYALEVSVPKKGKKLSNKVIRERYRAAYLSEEYYAKGRAYLEREAENLASAEQRFGVSREVIAAILWVETGFGAGMGESYAMKSLFGRAVRAKAFLRQAAAKENFDQLRDFFIVCKKLGLAPHEVKSSYAGALGMPQFMPYSYENFALDGDGDGVVDLFNSHADAIMSVANYLKEHGARQDARSIKKSIYYYNHSEIYMDTVWEYSLAIADPGVPKK